MKVMVGGEQKNRKDAALRMKTKGQILALFLCLGVSLTGAHGQAVDS